MADDEHIPASKAALRRRLRAARAALAAGARAAEELLTVQTLTAQLRAAGWPPVASYVAIGSELDLGGLHRLLWESDHRLLLPRVDGSRLRWHRVRAAGDLVAGWRGIREPRPERGDELRALPADCLLLVPGVGFDRDGARLGQGGGFYDRVLGAEPRPRAIGIAFACQVVDRIPREAHDRAVDRVLAGGEWLG